MRRVVGDGERVTAEVDLDVCDSGEPVQGRFYPLGSAKSGGSAAALRHAIDNESGHFRFPCWFVLVRNVTAVARE